MTRKFLIASLATLVAALCFAPHSASAKATAKTSAACCGAACCVPGAACCE